MKITKTFFKTEIDITVKELMELSPKFDMFMKMLKVLRK